MVFIISGTTKFLDITQFRAALESLEMVSRTSIPYFALCIPAMEMFIGAAIALELKTSMFCKFGVLLLAIFTSVMIVVVASASEVDCGCFGKLVDGKMGISTILRNLVLLMTGFVLTSYYENDDSSSLATTKRVRQVASRQWAHSVASLGHGVLITLVVTSLAALCLRISSQNKILKDRLAILTESSLSLSPGEPAQAFEGVQVDGMHRRIAFTESRRTLLFIMKSSCGDCRASIGTWNRIAGALQSDSVTILGVSLDSLRVAQQYASAEKIAFPLVSVPDRSFQTNFKISITPQTSLLSGPVVVKAWRGIVAESHQESILGIVRMSQAADQLDN